MRPNPSDPEQTVSVAIVATRLRSERLGSGPPRNATSTVDLEAPAEARGWTRARQERNDELGREQDDYTTGVDLPNGRSVAL